MLQKPTYSANEKLKQAILYVLSKAPQPEAIGLKKLCKLLYFADFAFYKKNNQSITGVDYLRWEFGPVPEKIYDTIEDLQNANRLTVTKVQLNDQFFQKKFEISSKDEFGFLSDEEREELNRIITILGSKSGKDLENLSHLDTPWQVTEPNQKIKYKLVFYRDDKISSMVE
jgi:uncharacterized phage-associated protein